MQRLVHPRQNGILAAIPPAALARLVPHLELASLAQGDVLFESGVPPAHLCFPTDSIVSLSCLLENGASAGSAIVGNEGVVGVALIMGGGLSPSRAVVQIAGHVYRLPARHLIRGFDLAGPTMVVVLRYVHALMSQTAQTAACNRHHSIDQQLCRWLLLSLDRRETTELLITQARLANLLGVRREAVSESAGRLQKAGIIRYTRGRITILDGRRLRDRVCECYEVIRQEYARLLPRDCPH